MSWHSNHVKWHREEVIVEKKVYIVRRDLGRNSRVSYFLKGGIRMDLEKDILYQLKVLNQTWKHISKSLEEINRKIKVQKSEEKEDDK